MSAFEEACQNRRCDPSIRPQLQSSSAATADEDPFFCVVEDDSLITEIKVTTDRLLEPLRDDEHIHDVHIIINVKTLLIAGNPSDGAAFAT
ncbi:MAG: hypothetical protein QOC81_4077 [Thermoanaerobaculia bacterium]|jgi:hypothetical protein|nr:hypothetical protein [Thermoanaerobaculia bacterium]